ncbi:MAG: hypothetical protein ACI8RA_001479 [Chlamydiales bacterium]|jgi:hypothetical protein
MSCCLSFLPCFRRVHHAEEVVTPKYEDQKVALLAPKISQVSYQSFSAEPRPSLRTRVITQKLKGFYTFLNNCHEENIPVWILSLQKLLDAPDEQSLGDQKEQSKNFLACVAVKSFEEMKTILKPKFESSVFMKAILASNRDHREVLISHFLTIAQVHYYGKLPLMELLPMRFPGGYNERLWESFITELMIHKGIIQNQSLNFSGQLTGKIPIDRFCNLLQSLCENRFVDSIDLSHCHLSEGQLRRVKSTLIGYSRAAITL